MKAAQANGYGDVATIQLAEVSPPLPEAGQVLVEVHAAGVNPFDYKAMEGTYQNSFPVNFPAIPGGDLAGVVSRVGQGVEHFEPGQPVYGQANAAGGHGSFAEFAVVSAKQLAPKPASLDYVSAAALPLAGASAWQAVVDHIGIQPGQKILVHGGAGGIGSLAIQIAKERGAYVATTIAGTDADFARQLGADETIDYHTQDFSQLISDYDAVFDTVGGETNRKSYGVLKPDGVLVSMVQDVDEAFAKQYQVNYIYQSSRTTPERLAAIAKLVDAGTLQPSIDKVFPLEQAGAALTYLKTGHPRGKVVIKVR